MSTQTLTTAQTGTAQTAPGERRTLRRVLWGAQIFIAAFLLFASALPKFAGQAEAVRTFEEIGWGQWFRYVTGAVEAARRDRAGGPAAGRARRGRADRPDGRCRAHPAAGAGARRGR
ncbi:DoxX family protein [Actinomadura madurae]|uniref:DoxX family protein n=1 Tax=Actinomadura madurae TaxID=1993 RepID=UPI0020D24C1F|nr:DoxX family protein [Actinomadura madurae]MCQ0011585.1 DoxX family protein [Actinomadura madurae]